MHSLIMPVAYVFVLLFLMHEFDAFAREEWKMFGILQIFPEKARYSVFLYAHIPLLALLGFYLYSAWLSVNPVLWVAVNTFSLCHLALHIFARRWKSNVFHHLPSFMLMGIWAAAGLAGLLLTVYY